jgi:hypothetical protein
MPVGPRVIDLGLAVLDGECDAICVCSGSPATYADAFATLALGRKDFARGAAFGPPAANVPNGRRVTSAAFADGASSATGTATHWAAVDKTTSRLLAWGPVATPFQTAAGAQLSLPSFAVVWPVS